MNERRSPVFVERQRYRRRRLIDALRMLPVIGTLLWAVPLLWRADEDGMATSDAIIFIFLVWFGLVVAGAVLARAVRRSGIKEDEGTG